MNEPSEEFGQQPRPTEGTRQPAKNQASFGPVSQFAGQQLAQTQYPVTPPVSVTSPSPASLPPSDPNELDSIAWQAPEYAEHAKGIGWVAGFLVGSLVLAAIAYYTGGWTFLAVTIVMAGVFGFFAFRPPVMLDYALTVDTIKIHDKQYSYKEFRSFGILHETNSYSAVLVPVKRLGLAVRLSFNDDKADDIVDILNQHLPIQEMHESVADKIMRSLRF